MQLAGCEKLKFYMQDPVLSIVYILTVMLTSDILCAIDYICTEYLRPTTSIQSQLI